MGSISNANANMKEHAVLDAERRYCVTLEKRERAVLGSCILIGHKVFILVNIYALVIIWFVAHAQGRSRSDACRERSQKCV